MPLKKPIFEKQKKSTAKIVVATVVPMKGQAAAIVELTLELVGLERVQRVLAFATVAL